MATASNGGGSVSLESGIRTCKVSTGWANKIRSDRFQNPNLLVCPVWNGVDTAGRRVCPDSFMTKRAGCNSAEDRVMVENNVSRPQYMEYINLNAAGIALPYGNSLSFQQEGRRNKAMLKMLPDPSDSSNKGNGICGNFGNGSGYRSQTLQGCWGMGSSGGPSAYGQTYPQRDNHKVPYGPSGGRASQAKKAKKRREAQSLQEKFQSYNRRRVAGF